LRGLAKTRQFVTTRLPKPRLEPDHLNGEKVMPRGRPSVWMKDGSGSAERLLTRQNDFACEVILWVRVGPRVALW